MRFALDMTLSLTWAVYATIPVIVGSIRRYAPIRYFAITVFAITIVMFSQLIGGTRSDLPGAEHHPAWRHPAAHVVPVSETERRTLGHVR